MTIFTRGIKSRRLILFLTAFAIAPMVNPSAHAQGSSDPAKCMNSFSGMGLSIDQKIDLCKHGGTPQCINSFSGMGLSLDQKIDLCKNGGTPQCINSLSGIGLSIDQKITLCKKRES